jgi:hypothetical protein
MPVKLTDKVYNEGGSPVQGAVAQAVRTNGTTNTVVATDITDTKGIWAFDSAVAGHQADLADPPVGEWYDVRINVGMQYRLRYGAIKAMMSMVYLAQTIVLGVGQVFDASAATVTLPAGQTLTDPRLMSQMIWGTGVTNLPSVTGNAGKWRFYKALGSAMVITPASGEALWAPGATASSPPNATYSQPAGESVGWYCNGTYWVAI